MNTEERQVFREPKTCFIPTCPNNDLKNPYKKFINIRKELKENWCQKVNRKCPKRQLFCCEDHIDFEEDLENYEEFLIGDTPKLKQNATLKYIPKESSKTRSRIQLAEVGKLPTQSFCDIASTSSAVEIEIPFRADVAVQCESTVLKNASVMVKPQTANKGTNFRARNIKRSVKAGPSFMSHLTESEDISCPSPSLFGSSNFESNTSSTGIKYDNQKFGREHLMKLIKNKPKMYLGLPKSFWWSIEFIAGQYSLSALHIIITLFKIKNNDTFIRMSEEFEIATSTIRLLFEKTVQILATYFQNFIYLPCSIDIKKNLPLVFKIRYSNVQCIIDCFEIQIEKPSDPVRQAQTWSQYKSCNTIKYLIACTPAGLITFISKGFGGRISDKAITDKSGFIDILPTNAVVMADRGFKEIESLLCTKNIKLLRPPSVFKNKSMTKKEAIETKVIASLRVHIERVIRKVREFHMLKPHSVVNHKHIKYLDEIVTIACGLINLQEPIIKEY